MVWHSIKEIMDMFTFTVCQLSRDLRIDIKHVQVIPLCFLPSGLRNLLCLAYHRYITSLLEFYLKAELGSAE
jgi:hypothetical protein